MKGCGKSAPGGRQRNPHGKPHPEQDRIGVSRPPRAGRGVSPRETRVGCLSGRATGRRDEWLPLAFGRGQNPAYRSPGIFSLLRNDRSRRGMAECSRAGACWLAGWGGLAASSGAARLPQRPVARGQRRARRRLAGADWAAADSCGAFRCAGNLTRARGRARAVGRSPLRRARAIDAGQNAADQALVAISPSSRSLAVR